MAAGVRDGGGPRPGAGAGAERAAGRGGVALPDLASLTAATRWEPTDAETWYALAKAYHRLLGEKRLEGADLQGTAFARAEMSYRQAIRRNPAFASAYFWRAMLCRWALDGGLPGLSAERRADEERLAEESFKAALRLAPRDATFQYEAGVFWWRAGRIDRAAAAFADSLAAGSQRLGDVAEILVHADGGVDRLLAITPDRADDRRALSRALLDHGLVDAAYGQWRRARELAGAEPRNEGPGVGVVADGGFEREIGESFHDWEVAPVAGVTVTRDSGAASEGARWLAVRFDRARADYYHVRQVVPVVTLARYRVSAAMRASGLAAGDRVGVEALAGDGASAGAVLCEAGAPASEGAEWTSRACEFQVPFGVWKVTIRLRRYAPERAEGSGTIGFDDVGLTEIRVEGAP